MKTNSGNSATHRAAYVNYGFAGKASPCLLFIAFALIVTGVVDLKAAPANGDGPVSVSRRDFSAVYEAFRVGKSEQAEKDLFATIRAPKGQGAWHLQAANLLFSSGLYLRSRADWTIVTELASKAFDHLDQAATLYKSNNDMGGVAMSTLLKGRIQEYLLYSTERAVPFYAEAVRLHPNKSNRSALTRAQGTLAQNKRGEK